MFTSVLAASDFTIARSDMFSSELKMYPICLLMQGFIPESSVIVNAPDCQALIAANGMGFIQYPVSLVL